MRRARSHHTFTFGLLSGSLSLGTAMLAGCASGGGGPAASSAAASAPAAAAVASSGAVTLEDPKGDDNGPGTYTYPTDKVYVAGAFDLTRFEVIPQGGQVEFRVTVASRIDDPWDSKAWGGNGFSVQMAFIHIDTDGVPGSGATTGLPGTNVRFPSDNAWDRVVIISPQGPTRVNSEVDAKAADLKARVVVPRVTRATGRTISAIVDVAALGGAPQATWGYQVLMQSNEGFPAKTDLLTRKINEYEGQHRFGGGTDYDNDPHVIDILAGPARGGPDEVAAQHALLSKFNKEATTPTPDDLAEVPLIYPGR